ncbi:MAG: single-stranded DNA-binding protein [Acidobacteriota bacterium]|nr:single-stranded DNA-binding protein [Acidobacteriota bacterium]
MLNLNRITLIGNTGDDAKTVSNGPTTISLATNVTWTDKQTQERRTRAEWHQLVVWNGLAKWAATLPKGTPLYVEGELIYEQYPRKVQAIVSNKTIEVEVPTRVAKIKVQRLIRLASAATADVQTESPEDGADAQ